MEMVRVGLQSRARGRQEVDPGKGDGFATIAHFNVLRDLSAGGRKVPLNTLLLALRLKEVTDAVDRINGLLGLVDQKMNGRLRIGYSEFAREDFWQGYLRAGKELIENDPVTFFSMSSSVDRPKGLPSWCVNLNSPMKYTSFINPVYKAGRSVSIIPVSDSICIQGVHVDEVDTLVKHSFEWPDIEPMPRRPTAARNSIIWEAACSSLSKRVFGLFNTIPEAHWRTLIANRIGETLAGPANRSEDYENMTKCFYVFADPEKPSLRSYDTPQTRSLMEYVINLENACLGRKFSSTKYGRVGLGPGNMEEGATVCIPYGAPTPMILLRAKSVDNTDCWHLIGDAYVHGLMNGEAMQSRSSKEKGIHNAEFIII